MTFFEAVALVAYLVTGVTFAVFFLWTYLHHKTWRAEIEAVPAWAVGVFLFAVVGWPLAITGWVFHIIGKRLLELTEDTQ